jgi:hypothetical protein
MPYVPIVLTRQGERLALRMLVPAVRIRMTPLFVLHPISADLGTQEPQDSVHEHVHKAARFLLRDWGTGPAFVDLQFVDTAATMRDGSHPLSWLLTTCAESGLVLSPVLCAGRPEPDRQAAIHAARQIGSSLCFRLPATEWADLGTSAGDGRLLNLLAETGRSPEEIDVILDLGDQVTSPPDISARAVQSALVGLPRSSEWRSLTVAGTGMPVGTAHLGADAVAELPRLEWLLWRSLGRAEGRRPNFGDYCVQHPGPFSDFDPRIMQSSAQLRYTVKSAWLVARGRGMKVAGSEQIRRLARQVVKHDQYAGPNFSWGDAWLASCAAGQGSAGNQMVWRKVTTNHHLTYVVNHLATLGVP